MTQTENLIQEACDIFETPFDDRIDSYSIFSSPHGEEPEHVTLHMVADEMDISVVKVRKLLISGGYYSTEKSRRIQQLYDEAVEVFISRGVKVPEKAAIASVSKAVGLGKASVYSYIPYKVTAYNLDEKSDTALRQEKYRQRKKSSENRKASLLDSSIVESETNKEEPK